jgi:hypothetical protein
MAHRPKLSPGKISTDFVRAESVFFGEKPVFPGEDG